MQVERPEAAHGDRVGVIGEQVSQPQVVGQTSMERIASPCSRGVGDGHVPTLLSGTEHPAKRLQPSRSELAVGNGNIQRALRRRVIVRGNRGGSPR